MPFEVKVLIEFINHIWKTLIRSIFYKLLLEQIQLFNNHEFTKYIWNWDLFIGEMMNYIYYWNDCKYKSTHSIYRQ